MWKGLDLQRLIKYVESRFVASVTVPSGTLLHGQVLSWMATNKVGVNTRSVTVHSTNTSASAQDPLASEYGVIEANTSAVDDKAQAKGPSLSYIPAIGSTSFDFDGHRLWLHRSSPTEEQLTDTRGYSKGQTTRREADITISCYSIFTELRPIQDFLEHVSASGEIRYESQVRIHRLSKYTRDGDTWDPKVISRPIRKLDSVSIEEHKKQEIIEDIKTYLSPHSKAWYANRGIPWRRGYLFYGPPGTGKTSFCTALAGHFGMELFILSLSSPHIDDEILETCFDSLPTRCLVLIEDVDSAGIVREVMDAKKKQRISKKAAFVSRPKVTLAGLLNIIDGPVSHEGRVLVMTSNSPDKLDPALIRPGRIDKKILFANASAEVIELLFLHIFAESPIEKTDLRDVTKHSITALAKQFARNVPEDTLSPAEVQNFLLENRQDPLEAVAKAESWAEGVILTKMQGRNVERFQGQIGDEVDAADKASHPPSNGVSNSWVDINGVDTSDATENGGDAEDGGSDDDEDDDGEEDSEENATQIDYSQRRTRREVQRMARGLILKLGADR